MNLTVMVFLDYLAIAEPDGELAVNLLRHCQNERTAAELADLFLGSDDENHWHERANKWLAEHPQKPSPKPVVMATILIQKAW